jgi:hypothetical protein
MSMHTWATRRLGADGRYTITDSTRTLYFQTAPGSAYRFLCDFYPVWVRAELREPDPFSELPVVHTA